MTPPKFHVGQKVRLSIGAQALFREFGARRPVEATVLEVRRVDGRRLYQVGAQIGDDQNDLWNADLREEELADASGERGDV